MITHQQQQKSLRRYIRVLNPQKIETFRFTFMWIKKKSDKEKLIAGTLLTHLEFPKVHHHYRIDRLPVAPFFVENITPHSLKIRSKLEIPTKDMTVF